jgi:hypothetical protein
MDYVSCSLIGQDEAKSAHSFVSQAHRACLLLLTCLSKTLEVGAHDALQGKHRLLSVWRLPIACLIHLSSKFGRQAESYAFATYGFRLANNFDHKQIKFAGPSPSQADLAVRSATPQGGYRNCGQYLVEAYK